MQPPLPGMPPLPPHVARARRAERLEPETGGSVGGPDQRLAKRRAASGMARQRWQSLGHRSMDDNIGVPPIPREEIGFKSSHWDPWSSEHSDVPHWASFHKSTNTSWAKMPVQEVPTPTLRTPQREVSPSRVNELINQPETRGGVREARGLSPEYPKVYRTDDGEDHLVDGNHRMTADRLRGQMFAQARVAHSYDQDTFEHDAERIGHHKAAAEDLRRHEYEYRHDPDDRRDEIMFPPGGSHEQRPWDGGQPHSFGKLSYRSSW